MTLLSMYKRDDSRTVYRILADQAVKHFENPAHNPDSKILFANLARLLERYRYDAFSYDVAPGILEVFKNESRSQRPEYVGFAGKAPLDVIPALESAHAHVYDTLSKEDLVQLLKDVLTQLATAEIPDDPGSQEKLAKAREFFVALREGLKEQNR